MALISKIYFSYTTKNIYGHFRINNKTYHLSFEISLIVVSLLFRVQIRKKYKYWGKMFTL